MRVTVCELPHEPRALAIAWAGLCQHTRQHASELVLLPEFAFVEPLWEAERFDRSRWDRAVALSDAWLARLHESGVGRVVGTRPVTVGDRTYNEGYLWSQDGGLTPLRRKYFLPAEPGFWESRWFDQGDATFPAFHTDGLAFGLNICTELWALETYAVYARLGVQAIMAPRATEAATTARWLAAGVVGAVRSGAFSLSSNRVDAAGACGGVSWIVSPEGEVLATTGSERPFATVDIDLAASAAARSAYPGYVFSAEEERGTVTLRPS